VVSKQSTSPINQQRKNQQKFNQSTISPTVTTPCKINGINQRARNEQSPINVGNKVNNNNNNNTNNTNVGHQ